MATRDRVVRRKSARIAAGSSRTRRAVSDTKTWETASATRGSEEWRSYDYLCDRGAADKSDDSAAELALGQEGARLPEFLIVSVFWRYGRGIRIAARLRTQATSLGAQRWTTRG